MKYKISDEGTYYNGHMLHRIIALEGFSSDGGGDVCVGDIGGFVEDEHNLSQEGLCWIFEDAKVYGNGQVVDDAIVCGNSEVYGAAQIKDCSHVYGDAKVFDHACVCDDCIVSDNANVCGFSTLHDNASVQGNATITSNSIISSDAYINDNAYIGQAARIGGYTQISGNARVFNEYIENPIKGFSICVYDEDADPIENIILMGNYNEEEPSENEQDLYGFILG